LFIPFLIFEIVEHRVIAVRTCIGVDGIKHDFPADTFEPGALKPSLDFDHMNVGERAWFFEIAADRITDLMHEHGRALHFVIGQRIAQRFIAFDRNIGVFDDRQRPAFSVRDAS